MDVQVLRGRGALQKGLLDRRLENQKDHRLARYTGEESSKTTDVFTRSFVASSGNGSFKGYDPRQNGPFDQHTRRIKHEYMR
jgi:hypothetical protein